MLWDRVDLGLRATNLTDEDYAERADFGFGSYRYFVGQPRGFLLRGRLPLRPVADRRRFGAWRGDLPPASRTFGP